MSKSKKSTTVLRNDWLFSKYQFVEQTIRDRPCYNCEGIFDVNLYLHHGTYFCHDCAVSLCEEKERPALKSSEQILERVQKLKKEVEFVAKEEFALKATVRLLLLEDLEQFITTGLVNEQK